MATYNNYNELVGKILTRGDVVNFTTKKREYQYVVYNRYLDGVSCGNSAIFLEIVENGSNDTTRRIYAEEVYGYNSSGGGWPEYKTNDYEAATKLVLHIYQKLNPKIDNWKQEFSLD